MSTVQRYDFGRLRKSNPVAGGGARMTARITRSGVFRYRRGDGSIRREYRPPSEVFHPDSLASLSYVPITDGHPKEGKVDTSNSKRLSVGTGGAEARRDGIYVESDIIVRVDKVLSRLDNGDLQETSAGYTCRLDMTPGVSPEGERFDCSQSNIRYNHVALGGKGWGRAETHIKLDSNDAIAIEEQPKEPESMLKFTIDGVCYDVNTPQFIQALEQREDSWKKEKALLTSERDTEKGKATGLQVKLDEAETKQDSKSDDFEKRVESLVTIRIDSKEVLGKDFDYAGKSELDIMRAVILKKDDKADFKNESDDFIRGTYNAIKGTATRKDSKPNGQHKKIASVLSFEKSEYKEDEAPKHSPGMGPLTVSKDVA